MSKFINIRTVLYYCDGVQLFDAVDAIGGRYLGLWIADLPGGGNRYLVVGVSPESLRRFRRGEIDLRFLIESRAEAAWFTVEGIHDKNASLPLFVETGPVPAAYLPDAGFVLDRAKPPAVSRSPEVVNGLVDPAPAER
jgi:hypothetical protein